MYNIKNGKYKKNYLVFFLLLLLLKPKFGSGVTSVFTNILREPETTFCLQNMHVMLFSINESAQHFKQAPFCPQWVSTQGISESKQISHCLIEMPTSGTIQLCCWCIKEPYCVFCSKWGFLPS